MEAFEIASISTNADIVYVNNIYFHLHPEAQRFILLTLHFFRETGQIYSSDRNALYICHERGYAMQRILSVMETLTEMQDQFLQSPGILTQYQNGVERLKKQYHINQKRLENAKNIVLGEMAV